MLGENAVFPHLFLGPFGSPNRNTGLASKMRLATLVLNVDVLDRQRAGCRDAGVGVILESVQSASDRN